MKKFALIVLLAAGCASTTVDPDNGMTNASYRRSIAKAEESIAALASKVESAQKSDRNAQWWGALLDNLRATRDQLHMALQGATK